MWCKKMSYNVHRISKIGRIGHGGQMKKAIVLTMVMALLVTGVTGCTSGTDSNNDKDSAKSYPDYVIDENATTLTIEGEGHEAVVLTVEDFQKLDQVTRTYSGRNKQVENARQFLTYTGVDLDELLEYAGYETEGAVLYVMCSDDYTREYELEDLHELYAFSSNDNDEKEEIAPMIALLEDDPESEYPCPFKLVYGQESYDTLKSQDFNMQGWLYYLQYIYVSYE